MRSSGEAWLDIFGLPSLGEMNMKDLTRMRRVTLSEASIQDGIQTIEEQGHYFEQVEYVSRSGKPFWADVSVRLFKHNGITYHLVVNDKIDRLKESEMQVARNKQRLSALLEHASMGILETDNNAEIIDINLSALKLFGYEKHEVLHRKIELLIPQRFHGRHVEHRTHYLDHPKNRPMGLGMDLFAVKKNGEEFPVEVSLTKYTMDDQPYVIAFISDISIRKKNELEIKKLNDELEETVEVRTRELKNAIQQLEASREELYKLLEREKELSELKSRFVSMASHEFRTPLSTVLSSAYLLEQYNTGEDAARQQKHLKRIVSSVSILTDTLTDT
ncbi:MAG: PAS domain S-box protein, partial [Chitinophagaceae bacterium]